MNETDMVNLLIDRLLGCGEEDVIETFEEVGLLTLNKGLVVSMVDGSQFQVTVVQSDYADEDEYDEDEDYNA